MTGHMFGCNRWEPVGLGDDVTGARQHVNVELSIKMLLITLFHQ